MSAVILIGFYLSDEFDPEHFAKGMRPTMEQGANLELDYAGVSDEDRERLAEHIRILDPVIIRLEDKEPA
jgi:hypothetical protein